MRLSGCLLATSLIACGADSTTAAPPSTPANDAGAAPAADDLASVLEPVRAKHGMPAMAAAVFDSKGMLAIGVSGERKLGSGVVATTADRWHLGSDTKAMTSTLIARLVDKGEARWDLTVGDAFPGATIDPGFKGITVEQLLWHRGGAPGTPPSAIWTEMWKTPLESREPRQKAVLAVLATAPAQPAGRFVYSNFGYMIAGNMFETTTSWEDRLTSEVFDPLAMKACGFGAAGTAGANDQPLSHKLANGKLAAVEPGPNADNPRSLGPAGTVHCSLEDWGKFLQAHLRAANGDTSYLAAATTQRLHTPAPRTSSLDDDYAMGWLVANRPWAKGNAFTHSGSNTMNYAVAWIAPGRDRVFVAVTNAGGETASKATDEVISALVATYAP